MEQAIAAIAYILLWFVGICMVSYGALHSRNGRADTNPLMIIMGIAFCLIGAYLLGGAIAGRRRSMDELPRWVWAIALALTPPALALLAYGIAWVYLKASEKVDRRYHGDR